MAAPQFPILDDHFHLCRRTGLGPEVIKEFMRSGGTHIVLVSLPSWSCGVVPETPSDFRAVFDETLEDAQAVRDLGCHAYVICGIHPAEIGWMLDRVNLEEAETLMKGGLDVAAGYVQEGKTIGLKSGRPHYPVPDEIWAMSNRVLQHALELAAECRCALQIHAETGSCSDVADMAKAAGLAPQQVVKHFATCDTPLHPSVTVREPFITDWFLEKRSFTLESDFMDDNSRPGAVNGPRSVPRAMQRMLQVGTVSPEDMWRVHSEVPQRVYGVEFQL